MPGNRVTIIEARDCRVTKAAISGAIITTWFLSVTKVFLQVRIKLLGELSFLEFFLATGAFWVDKAVVVEVVLILIVIWVNIGLVRLLVHNESGHTVQDSLSLLMICIRIHLSGRFGLKWLNFWGILRDLALLILFYPHHIIDCRFSLLSCSRFGSHYAQISGEI